MRLKSLKKFLKSVLPSFIYEPYIEKKAYHLWIKQGAPLPPSFLVKQWIIRKYKTKHKIKIFFETGTYKGATLIYQKNKFKKLYSIEIGKELYMDAKQLLSKNKNITLILGDSAVVLPQLIDSFTTPVLFYLDAHYSGEGTCKGQLECPVLIELDTILRSSVNHVVLIDDARMFGEDKNYPTFEDIKKKVWILKKNTYQSYYFGDFIVIEPIINFSDVT